jgi:hypothetical protein
MELTELSALISQPESDILEFKSSVPEQNLIARQIAGFANTKGGQLVFGIREDNKQIVEINVELVQKMLQRVKEKIVPAIEFQSEVVKVDNKHVVVVTIPIGRDAPYLVDGKAFQRKGNKLVRLLDVAPDVYQSAYNAIVSGSYAVAHGNGSITLGDGGLHIGGNINTIEYPRQDFIPFNVAYERIVGSTSFVTTQLALNNRITRDQSKGWYKWSLVAAILGFILFLVAIVIFILGQTTNGTVTAIAGLIPEFIAGLFYAQSRSANNRVDAIQKNLTDAHKLNTSMEIVNTIENAPERDRLKAEIVRKTLGIIQADDNLAFKTFF